MPDNGGFEERLLRMRRAMEGAQLDALVLRLPENVLLLSGWWPMIGASVLVFPRDGRPLCVVPLCYEGEAAASLWEASAEHYRYGLLGSPVPSEAIAQWLAGVGRSKNWRRIGYEANFPVLAPSWNSAEVLVPTERTRALYQSAFPGTELVDASGLLQAERRRKTLYEAARVRLASEISCFGLQAFVDAVDTGRTGVALAALVEHEIMTLGTGFRGALRVRAYAQVAVGPEETAVGYRPNEISTARKLAAGELAMLELGVVVDGYWADRTRVSIAGKATEKQLRMFELVRHAKAAAIGVLRPGITGAEVDRAARTIIEDGGYGDRFPHVTGHGLGFGYHESAPLLSPSSQDVLEEGMLTSVEPGIYLASAGGIRIEDDVLVTAGGAEILGAFPETLAG